MMTGRIGVQVDPPRIRDGTAVSFDREVKHPLPIPEKTDIIARCLSVLNANADISAQFTIILVKN